MLVQASVWGYRRNYGYQEAYEAGVSGVAASLESLVQVVQSEGIAGKAPGIFQLVIPAELVENVQ